MKILIPSIFLALLSLSSGCIKKTSETEIGIKIDKFSIFGKTGVQEEVYAPGQYHIYIPIFQELLIFDSMLQTIAMTYDSKTGSAKYRDDLLFKSVDGNDISLDVIIQYRIDPHNVHHLVQYVARDDQDLKEVIIRSLARSIPRDVFGELKTEEFYVSTSRQEKADKVKEEMNKVLKPMGVTIESVLTVDYRFNEAYQKAIEDKKIADQQAEQNKSATAAAFEEYKRKLEEVQGDVNQMIAKVDGEFRRKKIEADAFYEKMKQTAEAIEAEGIAQAKGIAKLNQALSGSGGQTMVKLEIAKSLAGKEIILLPLSSGGMNLKTTNVNELLKTYGLINLSKQEKDNGGI